MRKENQTKRIVPYNVIKSPVAKVVLATSLLVSTGASLPVSEHLPNSIGIETASAATTKKILNASVGETIVFGNADWVVLNPYDGLLQKKQPIVMKPLDSANKGKFDVSDPNNIGYFLNTTWLNTLKPEEKALIQTRTWTIQKRLWYVHFLETVSWPAGTVKTTDTWRSVDFTEIVTAKVGIMDANIGNGPYYNLAETTGGTSLNLFFNAVDNRTVYRTERNTGKDSSGDNMSQYNKDAVPPSTFPNVTVTMFKDGTQPVGTPELTATSFGKGLAANTPSYVQPFIYVDPNTMIINGEIKINATPTILTTTANNQVLSGVEGKNKLKIAGTVKDTDVGDTLFVKYTIDGIPYHTENNITYFTANGGNQSYEIDIKIDSYIPDGNHTLRIWVEDDIGAKSTEIIRTFSVDKTPPEITFSDVVEGKVYAGTVEPIITVTDDNSPTYTMTLNGKSYTGGAITESGKHTLVVNAKDAADNTSSKSISFTVNQTPIKVGTIGNKTWEKFKEEEFDLKDYFKDAENDPLTFQATSSDPSILSATITNGKLKLKALAIGTSTVNITANDGYTTSAAHTFDIQVTSRPPVLTLTNTNMVLLDDSKSLDIKGTVKDLDLEVVTITSKINGIDKVTTVPTTGGEDNWNLTYDKNSLPVGAFLLDLKAQDPYGSESIFAGKTVILKVPGDIANYQPILTLYAKDLGKNQNVIDVPEHTVLLDAYIAMEALKNNNDPLVWAEGKQKVELLVTGEVKKQYLNTLNQKILDEISQNPGNTKIDDLVNIGIGNTNPSLEKDYQDALDEYTKDLGGKLSQDDIQKVIDVINSTDEAIKSGDPQKILDAIEDVKKLEDGSLKDKLLDQLREAAKDQIIQNPSNATKELLDAAGFKDVDNSLITDYQDAMKDYTQPLDASSIQVILNLVNQVKKTKIELTQTEMTKLDNMLNLLSGSTTKDVYTVVSNTFKSIYAFEQDMTSEKFDAMNLLIGTVTTSDKSYFQNVSVALESVSEALEKPSDAAVLNAQTKISPLLQGNFKTRLQNRVGSAYLDHVINKPSDSTYEDLINAGLDNLNKNDFEQVKDAIVDMTDELGQLTKEQIQAIIDAINAVEIAKANPTEINIEDARKAVSKLPNSKVKTQLNNVLDTLWKSIQPKPKPKPPTGGGGTGGSEITSPEKPPVTLPPVTDKSEKTMVAKTENASVILELDKTSVAINEEVKMQIKVQSIDQLKDSKLTIYAKSKNSTPIYSASIDNLYFNGSTATTVGYETLLEINIMDLINGTYEGNKSLKFTQEGSFDLKAVFEKMDDSMDKKEIIETNAVAMEVFKNLQIPNTSLPNKHGLSVATLKAKEKTNLYSLDSSGNFVKAKEVEKDTLLLINDTYKSHYKLADGLYASIDSGTVHIGKGEVRKDKVNVYDKDGNVLRTITKGQEYKVYSYDAHRYAIGGGEYIELQDGVTYVFGWMTLKEDIVLYKKDGSVERTLKKGEKYRIYQADAEYLHLGGGYRVKLDLRKFSFLKN